MVIIAFVQNEATVKVVIMTFIFFCKRTDIILYLANIFMYCVKKLDGM